MTRALKYRCARGNYYKNDICRSRSILPRRRFLRMCMRFCMRLEWFGTGTNYLNTKTGATYPGTRIAYRGEVAYKSHTKIKEMCSQSASRQA